MEGYLHLVNPWLLAVSTIMLSASALLYTIVITTLMFGLALLAFKPYRTWVATQLYLIIGAIKNLYTKEIIWKKQSK